MSTPVNSSIEKLKGHDNYLNWVDLVRSELKGAGLWWHSGSITQRKRPVKLRLESDDDYVDKIESFETKVHQARALILRYVDPTIAHDCRPHESANDVWKYLEAQYKPSGLAYEYSKYQVWSNHHFDGNDIERFCTEYVRNLQDLSDTTLKISASLRVFRFLEEVEAFYPAFCATKRQEQRLQKDVLTDDHLTLLIRQLLDEHRAVVNAANSTALLSFRGKPASSASTPPSSRLPSAAKLCAHCKKSGHLEPDCFQKHPEKKIEMERKRKAKKDAEKAKKTAEKNEAQPQSHNNFNTAVATASPAGSLPPADPHVFGAQRMFMAQVNSSSSSDNPRQLQPQPAAHEDERVMAALVATQDLKTYGCPAQVLDYDVPRGSKFASRALEG